MCGCGQDILVTSNYRPGHDARHVANLVNGVLQGIGREDERPGFRYAEALRHLPTFALRAKFRRSLRVKVRKHQSVAVNAFYNRADSWFAGSEDWQRRLVKMLQQYDEEINDYAGLQVTSELLVACGWTLSGLLQRWS